MIIIKGLGRKRILKELPFALCANVFGVPFVLRLLFAVHGLVEDSIDYIAQLGEKNCAHPKHRLTGYHDFFIKRIQATDSVLDIGCGNGVVACHIAQATGATVSAIDRDKNNIECAKKAGCNSGVNFILGDAAELAPGHYDIIVLSNVLEHIEHRTVFLRNLVDKTTPQALLIRVPLEHRHWHVAMKNELGIDSRLDKDHFIEYTMEGLLSEVAVTGMELKHVEIKFGEIWAEFAGKNIK
ncbi:MAG: hypothetical protein A2219_00040 [Elusimicrobia bacterium RIFOXYA2_FULL_50_26]|nr:MAG: hypothetical protein A2219_00040 [Elusimicrobia bacterium RIFOXYA2_FULL_50_26]OGS25339.1 MAG: hypothetical protein A2314_06375 [Elusimicrobia bacterium RIFOXYB2_FULL_50_12]